MQLIPAHQLSWVVWLIHLPCFNVRQLVTRLSFLAAAPRVSPSVRGCGSSSSCSVGSLMFSSVW